MEPPAATLDTVARPWRTRALVASAVAALELVVIVAAGVALLGEPLSRQVRQIAEARAPAAVDRARPAPRRSVPATPRLARGQTSVLVLNGNGVAGAANAAGSRVHELGYIVAGTGNAPRTDYPRTLVMYRPGREGEGRRLARDLGIRVVAPLDGMEADDLMGAHVVVVLGAR